MKEKQKRGIRTTKARHPDNKSAAPGKGVALSVVFFCWSVPLLGYELLSVLNVDASRQRVLDLAARRVENTAIGGAAHGNL